jgi:hypothetical protein
LYQKALLRYFFSLSGGGSYHPPFFIKLFLFCFASPPGFITLRFTLSFPNKNEPELRYNLADRVICPESL